MVTIYQDLSRGGGGGVGGGEGGAGHGLFSQYIYIEFKNLLVRNYRIDFNITWQKRSFGDPLPR